MQLLKSPFRVDRICIIGGTGRVGQSLIPFLKMLEPKPVFFAENYEQACKLQSIFQDHLLEGVEISQDMNSIVQSDTIVFLVGARTAGGSGKNDLFAINKSLVDKFLPLFYKKNVVLVTNPTTLLGRYIDSKTNSFTIGVGVQNDFNRLKYQMPNVDYILGAHNLGEQIYYDKFGGVIFDGLNNAENLLGVRDEQDQFISDGQYADLFRLNSEADVVKWWRIQRFHSITNVSSYSCAISIMQVLKCLMNGSTEVVHGEVSLSHAPGLAFFIGVPILNGEVVCPVDVMKTFISSGGKYVKKYRI